MADSATMPATVFIDHDRISADLAHAFREIRLEHARLGRPVSETRDGQLVWLTPAEVFASYGLDEHGNPPATSPRPTA